MIASVPPIDEYVRKYQRSRNYRETGYSTSTILNTTIMRDSHRVVKKAYRGRHEIIAEILSAINKSGSEGVFRTSIMYKSFLSHAQLKEYFLFLVENDLIEEIHQRDKIGNEKSVYRKQRKEIVCCRFLKRWRN